MSSIVRLCEQNGEFKIRGLVGREDPSGIGLIHGTRLI